MELSHINKEGKANMVDVASKPDQTRTARAQGFIRLQKETLSLIADNGLRKGDVLTIAEIAGIQGGKKTNELIPLCHPLMITKMDVKTEIVKDGIRVESFAKCIGKTGIEMETLTAVNVALLTIYDMCKAVDKQMKMDGIELIEKKKEDV
ncbi:MAG: cyclic pyranopterin monophosphate synthase MoaC [Bacteroidales bacterium]|jgi:cyclic pyranopterin phosphate synthase|nr:cyclic pyranopterin monophosphate synthase MoaC [Bacteroidales bacterium]